MVVGIPDAITCAKFWTEILRGYDFTGVEFSVSYWFLAWALQQCSATALPVIHWRSRHSLVRTTQAWGKTYVGKVDAVSPPSYVPVQ